MNTRLFSGLAPLLVLALAAGCQTEDQKPADPQVGATETAEAAPPEPKLDTVIRTIDGQQNLYIVNREDRPVLVKRIILNDLPDDSQCNIHVFETIAKGGNRTTPINTCGNVLKASIETDQGISVRSWNPVAGMLGVTRYPAAMVIENQSVESIRIDRVVINAREGDPGCDIKVFETVSAKASITVYNTDRCGRIATYRVYTTYQDKDSQFDFTEPSDDGDEPAA